MTSLFGQWTCKLCCCVQKPKPAMAADGHIMSSGKISYDAFGQRMRVRNFGVVGNETFAMDQIMLFKKNVYYEIDWSKFSCKKKPLDSSFILMQVPKDAKLMGQVFLGSSSSWGMGVLVNTWGGELPNNGETILDEDTRSHVLLRRTITYNWVLGSTDPMDYIPPFFCAKAKLEEMETPDNMFTALESLAKKSKKE
uniref:Ependymin n=1 Tax=Mola mola TaxID=94237 RepID=A0A3Q4C0H7_MOLML